MGETQMSTCVFKKSRWAMIFAVSVMAVLSGCAGKGVKFEISPADNSSRQLQDLAQAHQDSAVPDKQLPEMTSDEFETLGDGLLNQGKYALAYVQYQKALKVKPDNIRITYKQGLAFLAAGKSDEAMSQFTMVVKKDPKFDLAYEGIGRVYYQKKDYTNAEVNFRKAVDLNHKLWLSYNYLGNIYDVKQEYEQAIVEYTSALSVRNDQGFIYNNLGVSCLLAGHYLEAVDAFNKAMEKNFRESRVNNNMALALANLGRYDEALEAFRLGGGEAHAYNNLGCVYLEKGKYEEAIGCFEKAIAIEPIFYVKASDNLKKARALAAKQ
jgi:tetratricopeptide (TPR) repeat protein